MNRVSQLFTKKFIATALLSFNGIDTYFQTFRYFFPSIPFDSQQNDPALLRRKFWLSGNFWLLSFKISYLCLPLFYETRTTPSCHPSGCAYRQL